jgi:hypothetical protein
MDYGFADRTVEYVDAKAIRSFLGVKGRTSLLPSQMRENKKLSHSSTHRSELERKTWGAQIMTGGMARMS